MVAHSGVPEGFCAQYSPEIGPLVAHATASAAPPITPKKRRFIEVQHTAQVG
jgi:hypothetical protein